MGGILLMSTTAFGAAATGFYGLEAQDIDGKKVPLSQYKGKVALVVNTASQCGYTPQYEDLEALYGKYRAQGLVVLGFPSNDFGGQEPGTNAEIKKFCSTKYKVSFPMFAKNPVKGDAKQPVYRYLTEKTDPKLHGEIAWNFEKFLVDKQGKVVARFKSAVKPMSEEIDKQVATLVKQTP